MNLWTVRNLSIPPINTYKATDDHVDIKHLKNVLLEGKNYFEDERYMKAECAVMSRIVYRMKQKFRSAKDFKALEKVHKAVNIYLNINISADLMSIIGLIPSRYKNDTYLPNKNLVDYILVRLQGLVKLMERIVETCKITAYLFERRMHTGHFWKIGFIIFAMVSRIYVLAKRTTKFICDFYIKVLPFSKQLKNNGCNFLPKNYILPTDLQQWLNVDWLDIDEDIQIIQTPEISNIMQIFDLVDDDDDIQFCDEYIMVDDKDEDVDFMNQFKNGSNFKTNCNINELRGFDMNEDFGEVIELNDENSLLNKNLEHSDIEENMNNEIINIEDSVQVLEDDTIMEVTGFNNVINLVDSFEEDTDVGEVIELNDTITEDKIVHNNNNGLQDKEINLRNKNKKEKQLESNSYSIKIKQKANNKRKRLKQGENNSTNVSVFTENRTKVNEECVILYDYDAVDDVEEIRVKHKKRKIENKKLSNNKVRKASNISGLVSQSSQSKENVFINNVAFSTNAGKKKRKRKKISKNKLYKTANVPSVSQSTQSKANLFQNHEVSSNSNGRNKKRKRKTKNLSKASKIKRKKKEKN